jgi:hypothetical protein
MSAPPLPAPNLPSGARQREGRFAQSTRELLAIGAGRIIKQPAADFVARGTQTSRLDVTPEVD